MHDFFMQRFYTFTQAMLIIKMRLIKLSAFIIALQILNMSIESPNAAHDIYTAPSNFNYIDSYVEYVVEVIFKHENAFPETGKRHQKQWHQHSLFQVICENIGIMNHHSTFYKLLQKDFFSYHEWYAYQFVKEISPPPKFSC